MITAKDIQNSYIRLYPCLRNYIWPFQNVEDIANLEIAVFNRFPDINKVKRSFNNVRYNCKSLIKDDEELDRQLDDMQKLLDSNETIYAKLDARDEESDIHEDK